ncbi:hypothetical protein ACLOJK_024405 [Asimina triloba]
MAQSRSPSPPPAPHPLSPSHTPSLLSFPYLHKTNNIIPLILLPPLTTSPQLTCTWIGLDWNT